MKNLLFLLTAFLLFSADLLGQTVPEGMRFQAVARDLDGSLLLDRALIVQVELLTSGQDEKVFYAETHDVLSSNMGVLDFVIGEGSTPSGKFSDIPWSKEEMWVRISVKIPGEENFQIISSGQLYSVPYALYANTAGSLVNKPGGSRGSGGDLDQTAIYWALDGNYNSHKYKGGGQAVLGTTDRKDLTMITKNIPRLIIDKDGNINILVSISIVGDLNVDGNTTLNGSLDVTNMSPTHFSGTLTVDKATLLNDALSVQNTAPAQMTGSLVVEKTMNVKGATTLGSSLDVTNVSPTHLTGTLTTDKATTLNHSLTVTGMSPTQLTGALDVDKTMNVDGATTLNNSLEVAGITRLTGTAVVDKATTLKDVVTVTNMAPTQLTGLLDVDKTMNVDGATTLNNKLDVNGVTSATHLTGTLVVDKATTLNDAVTVTNMAPTQLTGTLDVDQTLNVDGATTLNKTLDVTGNQATHLTGTLTQDKATTLNSTLTVNNAALTHLTGDLDVDGAVLIDGAIGIDGPLDVANMNPTNLTGTLEVDKLSTFKSGLQVTGDATVGPDGNHLVYFDNTEGGSSDGIAIKINTTSPNKENNYMTFYKGAGSAVAGRVESYEFNDIANIPLPTSDEIWTAVCIAIADYNPLTILWTQFATGFNFVSDGWNNQTIPSFDIPDIPAFTIPDVPALTIPNVPAFDIPDVPGFVIPNIPGVVIPDIPALEVGPYLCASVCFCDCCAFCFDFNCCCETVCLVPHFTVFNELVIPDFPGLDIPDFNGITIPNFPGIDVPDFPGIAIPNFPGLVIPATPAINMKSLFGTAPTIPTFSDILVSQGICPNEDIFNLNTGYFSRLVTWAMENRVQDLVTIDPIMLVANGLAWGLTSAVLDNGIVYGSKGADYAEYLPKLYPTEQFMKGDIVGLYNGKISKNTRDADQILAITSQPLVLGNTPDDANSSAFEKVAFLGQIPVYVKGPVNVGDYILPSGDNNGIAKAVPAGSMTAEMFSMILGRAWSDYAGEGVTLINTSIGFRPSEIAEVLKKQGAVEQKIQEQVQLQRDGSEVMMKDIEQMKRELGLAPTTYNP
ncbi:MAG TPA: hypothetical protein VFG10_00315 [Saprospiraceae bacterium]|nr:hypothetical protein [Saprospiraceae bacterium]